MPMQEILTLGAPPSAPGRPEWLQGRLVRVVADGVSYRTFWPEGIAWRHRPGIMPWWAARQLVGGRVSAAEFRAAVETLLSEGRLIEVRLARGDGRDAPHLLIVPRRVKELPREVAQVRGLRRVLEAESWARALVEGMSMSGNPTHA
jgi:hypothetical protein